MRYLSAVVLLFFSQCLLAMDIKTINVSTTQSTFTVKLPANPTTGFQWSLIRYDRQLFQMKQQYEASNTRRIGAGGMMRFDFQLRTGQLYPQQTVMLFQYARSWDIKHGMKTKMIIHFVAAKNNA